MKNKSVLQISLKKGRAPRFKETSMPKNYFVDELLFLF